jgi:SPP1 gp7 family putative phage head morphogenesis protein
VRPAEVTARMLAVRRAVGLARPPRKRLPRQLEPRGIAREYSAALLVYVERARQALEPLMYELPALLASARATRGDRRADAGEGKRVRELVEQAAKKFDEMTSQRETERLAEDFARKTATWQRVQMDRQTKAALGADVFQSDRALEPAVDGFVSENVALIKSLSTKMYSDIEGDVQRAITSATPHHELAKQLEHRYALGRDRARLIARDQVGKIYGQINAARQKAMGVTRFKWRTVNDNRVRADHEEREGKIYSYDDPPDGELPGEPILCRCYAEPVYDDLLSLLDDL